MPTFEELKILGFDHLEFAVSDLDRSAELYMRMGFEKLGLREIRERQLKSYLMGQNGVFVLLSSSAEPKDPVAQYVQKHGDGIIAVAFRCEDAATAVDVAARRGATVVQPPRTQERDFGSVTQASIAAFGDVRHVFISRTGSLFADGFDTPWAQDIRGSGLMRIHSLTFAVDSGKSDHWRQYYETIFSLTPSPADSSLLQSPNGLILLRMNEAGSSDEPGDTSVQDYLDVHHGPGIQSVALTAENPAQSLQQIQVNGVSLTSVCPGFAYEIVPAA